MSLPFGWIREQFPALDGGTVFLDNAAGSQVPRQVVEQVTGTLTRANANKGAAHRASVEVTEMVDRVRSRTAELLGAPEGSAVAFGPNATSLIGLLADAWRRHLSEGDEVVVTALDHHANVDPWTKLSASGVVVRRWDVRGPQAELVPDDLGRLLNARTRLLAITGASNALGTIPAVRKASDMVHRAGGHVAVDAVHLAPHVPPDVAELGVDMLVFSPYKVFGPHLGVLWLSEEMLRRLPHHGLAFMQSGQPLTWEPGTQSHEAIAGWGGTLDYLDLLAGQLGEPQGRLGWRRVFGEFAAHEAVLCARLLEGLHGLGAEIYGLPTVVGRTSTVSFNLAGRTAEEVAHRAASQEVAVSNGHYYAWNLMMEHLGLRDRGGAVRASAVHYNTMDDVERLLSVLA
ncbi:MAG TPA: cysteine desulfurase-like protein [Actinomycetota bacterium]|nr:cysteine desulfurase-like protein [Actinomycetota bacterium]